MLMPSERVRSALLAIAIGLILTASGAAYRGLAALLEAEGRGPSRSLGLLLENSGFPVARRPCAPLDVLTLIAYNARAPAARGWIVDQAGIFAKIKFANRSQFYE
jgi:hypothetical protein